MAKDTRTGLRERVDYWQQEAADWRAAADYLQDQQEKNLATIRALQAENQALRVNLAKAGNELHGACHDLAEEVRAHAETLAVLEKHAAKG